MAEPVDTAVALIVGWDCVEPDGVESIVEAPGGGNITLLLLMSTDGDAVGELRLDICKPTLGLASLLITGSSLGGKAGLSCLIVIEAVDVAVGDKS